MDDYLTSNNFLMYAAKHYDNPQCHGDEEFLEDLMRLKYIKKLVTRYCDSGELKERLILNHIITLSNVFKPHPLCKIIWLKMPESLPYVKPFLILLNILPDELHRLGDKEVVDTTAVPLDVGVVAVLRKI